ncbi:hypothetical protein A2U01_0059287, partial [Trifolium medium]|nr:hypothetical protein [Trifolium medium]
DKSQQKSTQVNLYNKGLRAAQHKPARGAAIQKQQYKTTQRCARRRLPLRAAQATLARSAAYRKGTGTTTQGCARRSTTLRAAQPPATFCRTRV